MSSTPTQTPRELTPEAVRSAYDQLKATLPGPDAPASEWLAQFRRWNELKCWLAGEASRRHFKEMQDSRDAAAEAAMRFMREEILPLSEVGDAAMREAFLASPRRPDLEAELGSLLFTRFELDQAAFAPTPTTDRAGIQQTIRALLAAGYTLDTIWDGEEETSVSTETAAIDAVMAVDDAILNVDHPTLQSSHVRFVMGNDPWEVVCDYGVSLEPVIGPLTSSWDA